MLDDSERMGGGWGKPVIVEMYMFRKKGCWRVPVYCLCIYWNESHEHLGSSRLLLSVVLVFGSRQFSVEEL